jgi:DNA-binding NarL/FixJ family response regulator
VFVIVQNIFGKLGVHSRLEAVAYANKHRMFFSTAAENS